MELTEVSSSLDLISPIFPIVTSQEPRLPAARTWNTAELAALPPLPDVALVRGAASPPRRTATAERVQHRLLHTTAPRWLCTLGFASLAAVPVVDLTRAAVVHATDGSAAPYHFEPGIPLMAALTVYWLGWLWWTVAASVNQRRVHTFGTSPFTVPVSLAASYGIVSLPPSMGYTYRDLTAVMFAVVGLLFVNLVALMSFRATAARIGADAQAWNRLMTVPFVSGALAWGCFLASDALGTPLVVIGVCTLAVGVMITVTSLHHATRSWDDAVALRRAAILR